jgi:hypothetical protein
MLATPTPSTALGVGVLVVGLFVAVPPIVEELVKAVPRSSPFDSGSAA